MQVFCIRENSEKPGKNEIEIEELPNLDITQIIKFIADLGLEEMKYCDQELPVREWG